MEEAEPEREPAGHYDVREPSFLRFLYGAKGFMGFMAVYGLYGGLVALNPRP